MARKIAEVNAIRQVRECPKPKEEEAETKTHQVQNAQAETSKQHQAKNAKVEAAELKMRFRVPQKIMAKVVPKVGVEEIEIVIDFCEIKHIVVRAKSKATVFFLA